MLRWSAQQGMSVFRAPANFTNGNYRDAQGRLVSCSHGRRCIATPAHGTAFDFSTKGVANVGATLQAFQLACRMGAPRRAPGPVDRAARAGRRPVRR